MLRLRGALTLLSRRPLATNVLQAIPSAQPFQRSLSSGIFDSLATSLSSTFKNLLGRKTLSVEEVDAALAAVKDALVDADVAQPVISSFIRRVRSKAVAQELQAGAARSTTVLRVVHDEMVELLGGANPAAIAIGSSGVSSYLLVGVQGSGKTTTCAKLAVMLQRTHYKSVLLVSLDNRRPAGQQQLALLAAQWGISSLPISPNQQPLDIVARAKDVANRQGHDCVVYDTAGRLRVEEELMTEIAAVRDALSPLTETLLVADAGIGNEAVRIATAFHARVPLTGIILTRLDGAARAGAALSMSDQTRVPVKLIGTGERVDDLKVFNPKSTADRILGYGDLYKLIEEAEQGVSKEEGDALKASFESDAFAVDQLIVYMRQVGKLGGIQGVMNRLPAVMRPQQMSGSTEQSPLGDANLLRAFEAMAARMTVDEKLNPRNVTAARKTEICKAAGTTPTIYNQMSGMHQEARAAFKSWYNMASKGKKMNTGGSSEIDASAAKSKGNKNMGGSRRGHL